jgi:ligand-binding SRPBCC domain-containing protein
MPTVVATENFLRFSEITTRRTGISDARQYLDVRAFRTMDPRESERATPMRFVKESRIQASPAEVFAFHESPGALLALTPPWESVEMVAGGDSIRVGSRVTLRTKLGPLSLDWVAEHTEYDPPHLFADRQVSGPFAKWYHRHWMKEDGEGGTLLRDEVEYEIPLGWLGRVLGGGFVRRKLQRMFDFRHEQTRRFVEKSRQTSS